MNKKRILSMLLCVIMVVTLFTGMIPVASAEGGDTNNGVVTKKTATLNSDGTYSIDIEAYATGTTTTTTTEKAVPLDIVLVLDQSGSMAYGFDGNSANYDNSRQKAMKVAVNNFIDTVAAKYTKDADHRISIVTFAGDATQKRGWTNVDATGKNTLKNVIGTTKDGGLGSDPSGGTQTGTGMSAAQTLLDKIGKTEGRQQVVILFTDGVPGNSGFDTSVATSTIKTAKAMKDNGVKVYTVGIFTGAQSDNLYGSIEYFGSQGLNTSNIGKNNKCDIYIASNGSVGSSWLIHSGIFAGNEIDKQELPAGNRFLNYVSSNFATATEIGLSSKTDYHFGLYKYEGYNITKNFDRTDNGYYLTAYDAEGLNSAFSTISEEASSSSTSVKLDGSAVLKDVIPAYFDCSNAKYTAKSVKVSAMSEDTPTAWGAETVMINNASVSDNTVSVDGFDYAKNYVAKLNKDNAAKLVISITGIRPTDGAATNEKIFTNDASSGIYFKDEMVQKLDQPTTIITTKNYVVDYAQPLTLKSSDWKMVNGAAYGDFAKSAVDPQFGSLEGMTYKPNTMNWTGSDSFYFLGTSTDGTVKSATANENGNLWAKVNVIPANNVYYEDTFVTTDSTDGIIYTGTWTEDGTDANQAGTANTAETAGGWQNASLKDDTEYSNGSAHMAVASNDNLATASFTFTGTGVDVYSRTNGTTGTIFATIKGGKVNQAVSIDNLLKAKDANLDFYQVPTLSFSDLPYGTYTVTIYVTTAAEGRATYYLDGIRVYNPAGGNEDSNYPVTERNAQFTEIRKLLIEDVKGFSADTSVAGAAFVDSVGAGATFDQYKAYGPENEVYLAKGQAIVFNVSEADNYYVGLSAPENKGAVNAEVTNGASKSPITVNHASDLYYKITPDSNGYIMIQNNSDNILAVSKLYTADSASAPAPVRLRAMSYASTMSYVNSFNTLSVVPYDNQTVTPDEPTDPQPTSSIIKAIVDSLFRNIKNLFKWF